MTREQHDPAAQWHRAGETIDRLITIDLPRRGVIDTIYPLARAHHGAPLSSSAALLLHRSISPGQVVLIATGWLDRPHVSRLVAETDGPPGAATLARALHLGLGAVPFLLVETELVPAMTSVVQAAGLRCLTPKQAIAAKASTANLHAAAVLPLPSDTTQADQVAERLCDTFDVGAFVSVEKGGMNARGRIHTSRGADTTDVLAKADSLLAACHARGIASIGIGDGGNELGMGTIAPALRQALRFGSDCGCGCGGGVVPAGHTDVLVAATVSNWGANAVCAALAAGLERPELLHSQATEEAVLQAAAAGGLIDGVSGFVAPTADGLDLSVHLAILALLRTAAGEGVDTAAWPA